MPSESSPLLRRLPQTRFPMDLENGNQYPTRSKRSRSVVLALGVVALAAFLLTRPPSEPFNVDSTDRVFWDSYVHSLEKAISAQGSKTLVAPKFQAVALPSESPQDLLYFNNSKAFGMLKTDDYSSADDFFHYQQGWEAQITQAYCAVASASAILNSLRGNLELPQDPIYDPFPWATQRDLMVNQCVQEKILPAPEGNNPRLFFGLGMPMAKQLLDCNLAGQNYDVKVHHVDPETTTIEDMREAIKAALFDFNARVMINYDRGGIGQGNLGHGHFSPIGAYNYKTDSFLIMDMAKYKYPPVWVPAASLYGGLATWDVCSEFTYPDFVPDFTRQTFQEIGLLLGCKQSYRGFIIVKPSV